jgi:hypothetical protein
LEKIKEALFLPNMIDTTAVKQRVKPVFKAPSQIEFIQVIEGLKKRFLTDIFGILAASQNIHGQGICFMTVPIHNLSVRLQFSLETAPDEFVITHAIAIHGLLRPSQQLCLYPYFYHGNE